MTSESDWQTGVGQDMTSESDWNGTGIGQDRTSESDWYDPGILIKLRFPSLCELLCTVLKKVSKTALGTKEAAGTGSKVSEKKYGNMTGAVVI